MTDPASQPSAALPERQPLWPWVTTLVFVVLGASPFLLRWNLDRAANARWQAVETRLAATHHTLDLDALDPPPVPDEQNFFAIPELKDIAAVEDNSEDAGQPALHRAALKSLDIFAPLIGHHSKRLKYSDNSPPQREGHGPDYGQAWQAEAWANYFRDREPLPPSAVPAQDVLHGLELQQKLIDALNAASQRPFAQILPRRVERQPDKHGAVFSHLYLTPLQKFSAVLMMHAEAEADSGASSQAAADICTLLRIAEGLRNEPDLIDSLVAFNYLYKAVQPAWSVLRRRSADEATLAALARQFEKADVQAMMVGSMRGEMAFISQTCRTEDNLPDLVEWLAPGVGWDGPVDIAKAFARKQQLLLNPRAALLGNDTVCVDLMLTYFVEPIEKQGLKALLTPATLFDDPRDPRISGLFGLLARVEMPSFRGMIERALLARARVHQVRIACALERYFIHHGSYPDELGKLVPEFLPAIPVDPIDDKPMRYRKTGDRYKLWSLALNKTDDGGEVKAAPRDDPAKPRLNGRDYPGDWVWSYEPLVPEAKKK